MNLEITWGDSPVEQLLQSLPDGGVLDAGRLLSVLTDEEPEEIFAQLDQRRITLSVEALPAPEMSGDLAVRLRRETELVRKGSLLTDLEETDPLHLYLQELAAIPAAGDVRVLAMDLLDGRDYAAERLVNLQLHRVVEIAGEYTGRGVLLLDLIQEGSLGLWQGILNYAGGDIESQCDWWIRQYMARATLLQALSGGLGEKLRQGLKDYVDVDQRLLTELGRNPTAEEIAAAMHLTARDVAVYADMLRSAQARRRVEEAREPVEPTAEDEQAVEDTAYFQSRQRIAELLSSLSQQEATLLSMRYGLEGALPLSPEQTGAKLGLTPEEVVAMEAAALSKLRSN